MPNPLVQKCVALVGRQDAPVITGALMWRQPNNDRHLATLAEH